MKKTKKDEGRIETLPAARDSAQSECGASSSSPDRPLRKCRILVAEDIKANQLLLMTLLERAGYEAVPADNGIDTVDLYSSGSFDLILMDCQMPLMSGIEAALRIRELESANGKHVPIIAVTAITDEDNRLNCLSAGMDGFVPKPLVRDILLSTIKSVLRDID